MASHQMQGVPRPRGEGLHRCHHKETPEQGAAPKYCQQGTQQGA